MPHGLHVEETDDDEGSHEITGEQCGPGAEVIGNSAYPWGTGHNNDDTNREGYAQDDGGRRADKFVREQSEGDRGDAGTDQAECVSPEQALKR